MRLAMELRHKDLDFQNESWHRRSMMMAPRRENKLNRTLLFRPDRIRTNHRTELTLHWLILRTKTVSNRWVIICRCHQRFQIKFWRRWSNRQPNRPDRHRHQRWFCNGHPKWSIPLMWPHHNNGKDFAYLAHRNKIENCCTYILMKKRPKIYSKTIL